MWRSSTSLALLPLSSHGSSDPTRLFTSLPLSLKLSLGGAVVLGCVDAVLGVVDEVEPGHSGKEEGRVAGLAGGNALHMRRQLAHAVQGLASLDLGDHLAHVELDLAGVSDMP